MIREAPDDKEMSFGVSGTRVLMEETKESVVGRRDIFSIPEELSNDVRIKKQAKR